MDTSSPRSSEELARWLTATSVAFLVLTVARSFFLAASEAIIHVGPVAVEAELTPWVRSFFAERDGIELTVCIVGLPLLGALVAALAWRLPPLSPKRWWPLHFLGLGAGARLVLLVRSSELEAPSTVRLAVVAALALVLAGWLKLSALAPRWARIGGWWALAGVLIWLVMASIVPASIEDHSYFYAPALEWLEGQRLGTFYVQYNLLTLLLYTGFVKAGLWVHETQVVLAAATVAWLGLYLLVGRAMLKSRSLPVLFVLAVFLFRFVAFGGHPSAFPQTTVLRLDSSGCRCFSPRRTLGCRLRRRRRRSPWCGSPMIPSGSSSPASSSRRWP